MQTYCVMAGLYRYPKWSGNDWIGFGSTESTMTDGEKRSSSVAMHKYEI